MEKLSWKKTSSFQACWVDPGGEIYPVADAGTLNTHEDVADQVINSNPSYKDEFNKQLQFNGSAVEFLLSKGWIRARGNSVEVAREDDLTLKNIETFLSLYSNPTGVINIETFDGENYNLVFQGKVRDFLYNRSKGNYGKNKENGQFTPGEKYPSQTSNSESGNSGENERDSRGGDDSLQGVGEIQSSQAVEVYKQVQQAYLPSSLPKIPEITEYQLLQSSIVQFNSSTAPLDEKLTTLASDLVKGKVFSVLPAATVTALLVKIAEQNGRRLTGANTLFTMVDRLRVDRTDDNEDDLLYNLFRFIDRHMKPFEKLSWMSPVIGWITDKGELISLGDHTSHSSYAEKVLAQEGVTVNTNANAVDKVLERGWIRCNKNAFEYNKVSENAIKGLQSYLETFDPEEQILIEHTSDNSFNTTYEGKVKNCLYNLYDIFRGNYGNQTGIFKERDEKNLHDQTEYSTQRGTGEVEESKTRGNRPDLQATPLSEDLILQEYEIVQKQHFSLVKPQELTFKQQLQLSQLVNEFNTSEESFDLALANFVNNVNASNLFGKISAFLLTQVISEYLISNGFNLTKTNILFNILQNSNNLERDIEKYFDRNIQSAEKLSWLLPENYEGWLVKLVDLRGIYNDRYVYVTGEHTDGWVCVTDDTEDGAVSEASKIISGDHPYLIRIPTRTLKNSEIIPIRYLNLQKSGSTKPHIDYDKSRGQQINEYEPAKGDSSALNPLEMNESWNTDAFNTPEVDQKEKADDSLNWTNRTNNQLWI